ncbi:hypothetical protein [Pelagibius sp. Alg239-R121]|uniref:hypothetical protein n=1 Tax=Pelagibius sp. Alg239-R121 TaxID=2993448 RepID=UPI0024A739AE|nr:hypothetical protein [Pelagibius sp. Alg239-R121]
MRLLQALCLSFAALFLMPAAPAGAAQLIMFEQAGCEWCEVWDEEISEIYPKTTEGKRAPLRRVDLHATRPEDLRDVKAVRFTPTFVLVDEGREIGRIQGYPGEDFFWGLLAELIDRLPKEQAAVK